MALSVNGNIYFYWNYSGLNSEQLKCEPCVFWGSGDLVGFKKALNVEMLGGRILTPLFLFFVSLIFLKTQILTVPCLWLVLREIVAAKFIQSEASKFSPGNITLQAILLKFCEVILLQRHNETRITQSFHLIF